MTHRTSLPWLYCSEQNAAVTHPWESSWERLLIIITDFFLFWTYQPSDSLLFYVAVIIRIFQIVSRSFEFTQGQCLVTSCMWKQTIGRKLEFGPLILSEWWNSYFLPEKMMIYFIFSSERRGFEYRCCHLIFFSNRFSPSNNTMDYGPGVSSASNINEYHEYSWGVKRGRRVRLTTSLPHRHVWADCLESVGVSTPHNRMSLHSLLQGSLFI
jgi:hypothetical protein